MTERPGLYTMILLLLLNSCGNIARLNSIQDQLDGLTQQLGEDDAVSQATKVD